MKSVLRILAISMAVLGLMALSASAAQALEWRANGAALATNETFRGNNENPVTHVREPFVLSAAGGLIVIECERMEVHGEARAGTNKARNIVFTFSHNCVVKIEGSTGPCSVSEPITTNAVESTTTGNGSQTLTTYKPESGTVFVGIVFTGAECPLLGTQNVEGEGCSKGEGTGTNLVNQPQSTNATIEGECGTALTLGEFGASLAGNAWIHWNGPRTGQTMGIN